MKNLLPFLALVMLLFSCKNETSEASLADLDRLATLENQVNQLTMDNQMKDSMLNEAIGFFNDIQRNLASIGLKESELKTKSANPEVQGNEKEQILEQINYINFLRTENAKKIQLLQNQLKETTLKSNQLQEMLSQLTEQIRQKDQQIESLQQELAQRDQEYAKLFDQYQIKAYQNEELISQLNTVYYVYGSSKELKENQVISESKGFIGMGKKAILKTGFNESYFTETSIDKSKSISISGKSIKLITDHPSDSFQIVSENGGEKLKITNPKLFWKVSKYLVVIID